MADEVKTKRGLGGSLSGGLSSSLGGLDSALSSIPGVPSGIGSMVGDWASTSGVDFTNPNLSDLAKTGLSTFLTAQGVPPMISDPVADFVVDTVFDLFSSNDNKYNVIMPESLPPEERYLALLNVIPQEYQALGSSGGSFDTRVDDVVRSKTNVQLANEAIDIDRYLKDEVKGFLPPMNWYDKLPDWPAFSYTSIILDQTRASKKYIVEGLPSNDDIELQIEARKFPYKSGGNATLMKGKVDPGTKNQYVGVEVEELSREYGWGLMLDELEPKKMTLTEAVPNITTESRRKFEPITPIFEFPQTVRDDLTDQRNPALDLVDAQKLVDEFLLIGRRIYDSGTENPHIFGFDDINSKYEKDKNIMLANLKQFKANVRKMEYISNIVENNSNNYLIKEINYRNDLNVCSVTEEHRTRYLREKLLAWYNEEADPDTKTWKEHHWIPGEPGYLVSLLTVGDYEWYDNLVAGLEDSVARLEDLEATMDLLASMANIVGTIEKYKTAIEQYEIKAENVDIDIAYSVFTNEIIDYSVLKELLGLSEIIGSIGGELTPIRGELESLRWGLQGILEEVRVMSPTFLSYPIIWETLDELASKVKEDIHGPLNTLILDLRGDFETEGKHSSPSHLELNLDDQLSEIVSSIAADVQDIIDRQAALPTTGLNILDSMLNKINEIRIYGPLCSIPFHYQVAIDNVNAAERYYNDIWSDVFDCWEREYITRVWRVVTEHHIAGVIPAIHYGKPLFSAECPHHLPLLLAPVPVDYRDIDINYLSANCRKDFNFFCSWLTSALYAIGIKRVALAQVINDTSLNGNDENVEWLSMLNELNAKNNTIRDEMDKIIAAYDTSSAMLPKANMDEIVAAKELSPRHYSNQVLLNMSSQLHLLNTFPITELKVATNENRTGTIIVSSEALKWDALVTPTANTYAESDLGSAEYEAPTVSPVFEIDSPSYMVEDWNEFFGNKADMVFDKLETKYSDIFNLSEGDAGYPFAFNSEDYWNLICQIGEDAGTEFENMLYDFSDKTETSINSLESYGLETVFSSMYTISEGAEVIKSAIEIPNAENEIVDLIINPVETVGGPAEIVIDTGVDSDAGADSEGAYVGDVAEFSPWHYMQPDWDTQKEIPEPVIIPVDPVDDVVPSASVFLEEEPEVFETKPQELTKFEQTEVVLGELIREKLPEIEVDLMGYLNDDELKNLDSLDYQGLISDFLSCCGIDLSDPTLKDVAKMALSQYLTAQGVPPMISEPLADSAVESASSALSGGDVSISSVPSLGLAGTMNDLILPNVENMDSEAKAKSVKAMVDQFKILKAENRKK